MPIHGLGREERTVEPVEKDGEERGPATWANGFLADLGRFHRDGPPTEMHDRDLLEIIKEADRLVSIG